MSGSSERSGFRWKTVWVCGASSGIGRELATRLGNAGVTVAISARSGDVLREMESGLSSLRAFPLDVTDAGAVSATVEGITESCGPIDLAVLSAGTWTLMDAVSLDPEIMRRSMDVNYGGVANAVAALLPGMLARGRGRIAIMASVAGYRGLPRAAAYGPTKAALINLAETLKPELAAHGVDLSLVNPGFVDTPMTAGNPFPMPGLISAEEAAERLLQGLLRGRYEIIFPTLFGQSVKALKYLPNALFFWLTRRFLLKRKTG